MYVLKGVAGSSSNIENANNCSSYAASGISLSGTTLSNVSSSYVFTLEKQGSYYSVKSASTNAYLASNANNLYSLSSYDSSYCRWTPGYYSNTRGLYVNCSGSYRYLSFYVDDSYFWAGGTSNNTNYQNIYFWKKVESTTPTYTVTYDPNGGNGTMTDSNSPYSAGATVTVLNNTFTRDGYNFVRWNTKADGTGVGYSPDATFTINENTTLYAQWSRITYTVSYMANGSSYGTPNTVNAGSSITLPGCDVTVDGWTFSGWVTSTLAETTNEPTYYAPGDSYTVNGNVTLYALYTRSEGSGSTETVYELVTSTPSSWAGNYVITNSTPNVTTTGMYVLKGVTGSYSGTSIESASNRTAFADTGITIENNVMRNVANDYVMTIAASGSYYSIKAPNNTYFGMNSNSNLSSYTTLNTT